MPESPYTGRFVVRLADSIAAKIATRAQNLTLSDWETLQDLAGELVLDGLTHLFARYPPHPTSRGIAGVPNSELLKREEVAAASAFPPIHSLTAYYIVDSRPWGNRALSRRYLADLRRAPEVGLVYEESKLRAPGNWVVDPTDPLVPQQGYLNAAPQGVGANTVEVWGSFDGAGVGFVDVESGWNLNHVDLPRAAGAPQPIVNDNDPIDEDHGTAVLGVVLAKPDGAGITGIAPGARFTGVASWFDSQQPASQDIAGAIYAATWKLKKGDILLLEVETEIGYPVEVEDLTFDQIRNAAGNERIVIEPAGNGTGTVGRDLDKPPTGRPGGPPISRSLNRTAPSFLDSGAILVSACRSSVTSSGRHRRNGFAGFGTRVDCYAWGDNVATAGGSGLGTSEGRNNSYTDSFHGTSSASAIIAGVAILVQHMARQKLARNLLPLEMRTQLSDPANGTGVLGPAGSSSANTMIGVMPDLRTIGRNL